MVCEVRLPDLGPDADEGSVISWSKQQGDPIAAGEVLCEIEAGKATMSVTAPGAGILRVILAEEGDLMPSGALLAIIAGQDDDISSYLPTPGGG